MSKSIFLDTYSIAVGSTLLCETSLMLTCSIIGVRPVCFSPLVSSLLDELWSWFGFWSLMTPSYAKRLVRVLGYSSLGDSSRIDESPRVFICFTYASGVRSGVCIWEGCYELLPDSLTYAKPSIFDCFGFIIVETSFDVEEDERSLPLSGSLLGRSKGRKAGRPTGLLSCWSLSLSSLDLFRFFAPLGLPLPRARGISVSDRS